MNKEKLEYIEEFGVFYERFGSSRMLGRVLGALMVSEPPEMTAEELAGVLSASRGSISTATRTLVGLGMVRRFTRPGERRDYFQVEPDGWYRMTRESMAGITLAREIANKGLALLDPKTPDSRESLEEMRDFCAYWERILPECLERWETERKEA